MTNKPMLSVEPLKDRLIEIMQHLTFAVDRNVIREAIALIDKPAAQRQGEPVRWERMSKMGDGTWWPCANKEEADEAVKCGYTVRPLYAEQPAQVAVVMPEREPQRITDEYARGWNDYDDEYKRLNGVKP